MNAKSVIVVVLMSAGMSACYTPRDVRPAAVTAAKATVEQDLPPVALELSSADRSRTVSLIKSYLERHPEVYGMAFAPAPVPVGQTPPPALYVCRHGGGLKTTKLALPEYDYPRMEWYWKPVQTREACWSAPYFDEDGGEVWMQTYSIPVIDANGGLRGVVTNDVPVYGPGQN